MRCQALDDPYISAITNLERDRLNKIVDTYNISVKVIKETRKIGIIFSSSIWKESLKVAQQGTEIVKVLSKRGVKSFLKEKSLYLFLLEQLFDANSTYMLSWERLKNLRNQKSSGKKPIWLEELKEMYLANTKIREIKEVFKQSKRNILVLKPELNVIVEDE